MAKAYSKLRDRVQPGDLRFPVRCPIGQRLLLLPGALSDSLYLSFVSVKVTWDQPVCFLGEAAIPQSFLDLSSEWPSTYIHSHESVIWSSVPLVLNMAWIPGCLLLSVTESTWEEAQGRRKPKGGQINLLYSWALLFCYLTARVEKPHGHVKLSGSILDDRRQLVSMRITEWAGGRAWPVAVPPLVPSARKDLLSQQQPPLPSAFAMFSPDLCIDLPLSFTLCPFCRNRTSHTCFSLFAHCRHLGAVAEF